MKILLLAIHYPPMKTSCAVQMRDLAIELLSLGHKPIVVTTLEDSNKSIINEKIDGINILRIKINKTKRTGSS